MDNHEAGMREIITGGRGTIARLMSYIKRHKGLAAACLALALVCNLAEIIQPYLLQIVIDRYLTPGIYSLSALLILGGGYLLSILAGGISNYFSQILTTKLGQTIVHRLRTELFSKIQLRQLRFFDLNASGKILTRINTDVDSLSDLYSDTIIIIIKNVLLVMGTIAAMFMMNAHLALWSMISIPFFIIYAVIYTIAARNNYKKVKAQTSKINAFLAENIIGMKVVQLYAREKKKLDEFHALGKRNLQLGFREVVMDGLSYPFILLASRVMTVLLISIFASSVLEGAIEVGVIYAFTTYIKQLFYPIAEIAEQFSNIQSALVSAERVFDILDDDEYVEDLDEGIRIDSLRGEIEFDHVCFAYDGENYVVKDVSFKIPAGSTCAFVGTTGSGKSTIISLLARFYTIQRGAITIDGVDISRYNLSDLRRCIAVVMQDVFIFSGDIRYNIRLNDESISDDEIAHVTNRIITTGFMDSFEDGFDHTVAERGMTFSAGERQLIAFARALVCNPSVLILDEATSNIDLKTELAIQSALETVSSGRTAIIIAHRIETVSGAERIFVMSGGELVESGSHEQLCALGGIYAGYYELSHHGTFET